MAPEAAKPPLPPPLPPPRGVPPRPPRPLCPPGILQIFNNVTNEYISILHNIYKKYKIFYVKAFLPLGVPPRPPRPPPRSPNDDRLGVEPSSPV